MNEKIVNKIRLILAKTEEAGCTPAEAETALAMASRLLAEHNLSMDDLGAEPTIEDWVEEGVAIGSRWELEDNLCYHLLQNHFFVKCVKSVSRHNGRQSRVRMLIFGKAENVETAKHVHRLLVSAADSCWARHRIATRAAAVERRLFVTGLYQGFSDKIKGERQAMEAERDMERDAPSGSTALSVIGIKEATNKEFVKRNPGVRTKSATFAAALGSQSTFDAGYQEGRRLNISKPLGQSPRKELPSC